MDKNQFIGELKKSLAKLPESEIEKSIAFYLEIIDDRIEEGESEEQAIAAMGDPSVIARTIVEELPALPKVIIKSKTPSKVLNWILLILGSPIWFSLAFAGAAVLLSVYLTIWSLVVAVWIIAVSFLAGIPLGIFMYIWGLLNGQVWYGVWELGAGFVLSGIGVFCLNGAIKASGSLAEVSKRYIMKVRSWFKKKEPVNEV